MTWVLVALYVLLALIALVGFYRCGPGPDRGHFVRPDHARIRRRMKLSEWPAYKAMRKCEKAEAAHKDEA